MLLLVVGTKKYTTPDNSFAAPENIFNQLKKNLNVVAGGWHKKKYTTPENSIFCVARKHIQSIKKKNLNVVAGGGWHKKK